jgi:hypothetical protein
LVDDLICFIVLNVTFSNISVISWRPVLMVEEARILGKNHRPWASDWYALSLVNHQPSIQRYIAGAVKTGSQCFDGFNIFCLTICKTL